jgi:hypothetical protein
LSAYNDQIDAGNFDNVTGPITVYIHTHFVSGCDLNQLESNITLFSKVFSDYDLPDKWQVEIPQLMVMNLMGQSGDPIIFFGESAEEQTAIVRAWEGDGEQQRLELFYFLRMIVACFMNEMVVADRMRRKLLEKAEGVWIPYRAFFECVILCSLVRSTKEKKSKAKYQEKADEIMSKMTDWYNDGAVNCYAMVLLLEAELLISVSSKKQKLSSLKVQKVYDEAIETAKSDGLLYLEAWANERAALHYIDTGVPGWASSYFTRAHQLYGDWGAMAKVDQLEALFSEHLAKGDAPAKRMSASAWRTKYDENRESTIEQELDAIPSEEQKPKSFMGRMSLFSQSAGQLDKNGHAGNSPRQGKSFSKKETETKTSGWKSSSKLGTSDDFDEEPVAKPPRSLRWGRTSTKDEDGKKTERKKSKSRSYSLFKKKAKPKGELLEDDDDDGPIGSVPKEEAKAKGLLSEVWEAKAKAKGLLSEDFDYDDDDDHDDHDDDDDDDDDDDEDDDSDDDSDDDGNE